ncbi:MAG: Ubiquinone/menaquinone biosynthesis C-methyltransferase UbiE [Alphaproteobacteria bacterium MarineAlpha2_Bin1]|nr:MAG: Ubiquinone/menaquinone biosynthesis C-methyltransferase UbiE [Alphaproteobacteria bacterium MarineAlpha2_Bin1]
MRNTNKKTEKNNFTHFGSKSVPISQKTRLVKEVFESVAKNYDLMNDLMSLGLHRKWKDSLVKKIYFRENLKILDVASGTGDIINRISKTSYIKKINLELLSLDLTHSMIKIGRDRIINRGLIGNINWINSDATSLPFKDHSIDVYVIAFGIRNITNPEIALHEAFRVLKPGGQFLCLEFSKVDPFYRKIYDLYSFKFIPNLGRLISNDKNSYQYLVESIRKFPNQKEFSQSLSKIGFSKVKFRNLNWGIAAIHSCWKL